MGATTASESPSEGGGALIRSSAGRGGKPRPRKRRAQPAYPGARVSARRDDPDTGGGSDASPCWTAARPISEHPELNVGPTVDADSDPVGEGAEGPARDQWPGGPSPPAWTSRGQAPGTIPSSTIQSSTGGRRSSPCSRSSPAARPPPTASSMRSAHMRTRSAGCGAEAGQTMCRAYVLLRCRPVGMPRPHRSGRGSGRNALVLANRAAHAARGDLECRASAP